MFTTRDMKKIGCTRDESRDFSDDGTRFQGWSYVGLPITYTKCEGYYYLDVRFDYISDICFADIRGTKLYELGEKFNGVRDIDALDLENTLSEIRKELKALYQKIHNEVLDATPLKERLSFEYNLVDNCIQKVKKEFNPFSEYYDDYSIKSYLNYVKGLERDKKNIKMYLDKINDGTMERQDIKSKLDTLERCHHLIFDMDNDYYYKSCLEMLSKQ